jgi:hypothetical protein
MSAPTLGQLVTDWLGRSDERSPWRGFDSWADALRLSAAARTDVRVACLRTRIRRPTASGESEPAQDLFDEHDEQRQAGAGR